MSSTEDSIVLVTLEGSVTPCVVLARGARCMVRLTPKVQRLIDRGFVVEVDRQVLSGKRVRRGK